MEAISPVARWRAMALRRRAVDRVLVPLLALLLLGAQAAAPTAEQAARDARQAFDRAQYDAAEQIIEDALRRFGSRQDETLWTLRIMRGEVLHARGRNDDARKEVTPELPPGLRTSKPAVRRLLTLGNSAIHLGRFDEAIAHLNDARTVAAAHQPAMLPDVYSALTIA